MTELWRHLGHHCFFIEEDFLWYDLEQMFSHNRGLINPALYKTTLLLWTSSVFSWFTVLITSGYSSWLQPFLFSLVDHCSVFHLCPVIIKYFYVGEIRVWARFVKGNISAGEAGHPCVCMEQMATLFPDLCFNLSVPGSSHLLSSAGLSSLVVYFHAALSDCVAVPTRMTMWLHSMFPSCGFLFFSYPVFFALKGFPLHLSRRQAELSPPRKCLIAVLPAAKCFACRCETASAHTSLTTTIFLGPYIRSLSLLSCLRDFHPLHAFSVSAVSCSGADLSPSGHVWVASSYEDELRSWNVQAITDSVSLKG